MSAFSTTSQICRWHEMGWVMGVGGGEARSAKLRSTCHEAQPGRPRPSQAHIQPSANSQLSLRHPRHPQHLPHPCFPRLFSRSDSGMQVLTLLCVSLFFLFSTNTPLSTATRPTRAPRFPSILRVVCCPGAGCRLSLGSPFTTSYREGGEARWMSQPWKDHRGRREGREGRQTD